MKACEIADTAAKLMSGDRAKTHGDKLVNHQKIATLWNAFLEIREEPAAPLRPSDVAHMMVLLKMARTQHGTLNLDDSVDQSAYAAIAGELMQAEESL